MENKRLGRPLSPDELKSTVYHASVEVRTAAGFGELIIVTVFLPIFALVGIEGKMFIPMAATFAIAVLAALAFSFTTVPALASLFLSGNTSEREPWLTRLAKRIYARALESALRRKVITLSFSLVCVAGGVLLFSRLGGEFLPQLDEGSFNIEPTRPQNIGLDHSVALEEKQEAILQEFPEVANVFSILGTAEIAADPMGPNQGDEYVMLKERDHWPQINGRKRTKAELGQAIMARLEGELPGQRLLLTQPIQMRFNELLEGTKADVAIKIFGEDLKELAEVSQKIADVVRGVQGAGDVDSEQRGTSPVLKISPKEGILKRLGVSTREVLETVGVALGGQEAGFIYDGLKRYPIVVRLGEAERADLDAIKRLPVGIASNATIPLENAAHLKFENAFGLITREQLRRRAAVLISVRGRDTESFVEAARKAVGEKVKLPTGYYVEWGGNFKNLHEARARLGFLAPLTLLLVLMMIYVAFGSFTETLLVFLGVPLALVGGALALTLQGLPFSISAGIGFIALSGIAVLNGVVLINYFNELRKKGMEGVALVREGTSIRLRPVLMTALVEVFGFLPMMMSQGAGAEVQRPLATVVIGGVISSTILTLFVLPTLYCVFERTISRRYS